MGMERNGGEGVCAEPECHREAAVRLHVPWEENRDVCPACGRSLCQQEGVVAEPIEGRADEWS